MTSRYPSSNGEPSEPVTGLGLCLSGGGVTGAMYEVGCLVALEETFEGFSACDFEVIVGTSSGSTVATALAGGISATRLYRALLDPADDFFPLQRQHLLRVDSAEWRRVWGSALGAARHLLSSATSKPLDLDVWTELERFIDSLPAGIFNLDAYERFLNDFMRRRGIPSSFSRMPRKLALVASDLDAGERVVFGVGKLRHVPVSRAVVASSAIPILYAPVRIKDRDYVDGGLGEVGHVDVAEELGCDTIVVINPMVPVKADLNAPVVPTGHGKRKRVRDKGLLWVNNQAWRMRTEARFRKLLDRYLVDHPDTVVLLLEPASDDAVMFMYSPMNFAVRRSILEDGYKSTMQLLRDETSPLTRALVDKGLVARSALATAGAPPAP
jgi:predicted acylesterase/phospholipase RssA